MSAGRVRPFHRVEYALLRGVLAVLSRLPEGLAYGAAGAVGSLYLRYAPRRQRIALRQLRNAFPGRPDRELLRLARRGVGNLVQVTLDMARMVDAVRTGRFVRAIELEELDAFAEKVPRGPFVGVTAHLGCWEAAAVACATRYAPLHVTARLMKNPLAQAWLRRTRQDAGVVVHDRRGGIRGISRAVRDGHVVMQVVDQNQRLRGVSAPWFGETASCERGAATLAVRHGIPLAVGGAVRTGRGFRFRMVVQDVLHPDPLPDDADPVVREQAVQDLVVRMNRALEDMIRRFPEQYLWIHDRYRTRPGGADGGEPGGVADDAEAAARGTDGTAARGESPCPS